MINFKTRLFIMSSYWSRAHIWSRNDNWMLSFTILEIMME